MFNFLLESTTASTLPTTLITILLFGVIIYFFMIRPQKKQEKKDADMRNSLSVGDEVTTIGGIIGKVISIKDETFVLETTREKTRRMEGRGGACPSSVLWTDLGSPWRKGLETRVHGNV